MRVEIFDFPPPPEILSFLGPRYRETNLKSQKNKIGISFSLWDANGDKFFILAVSGYREVENRISHVKKVHFGGGMFPDLENTIFPEQRSPLKGSSSCKKRSTDTP